MKYQNRGTMGVQIPFSFPKSLDFKPFQTKARVLPWQTNNTFIINEFPPKIPYSAPICRSLPTINFALRLLNLSYNEQNAANRGKLRT